MVENRTPEKHWTTHFKIWVKDQNFIVPQSLKHSLNKNAAGHNEECVENLKAQNPRDRNHRKSLFFRESKGDPDPGKE